MVWRGVLLLIAALLFFTAIPDKTFHQTCSSKQRLLMFST
jgi:hypothetical protein